MTERIFITGTDTDIGKTTVAVHLLNQYRLNHKTTAALKPVACGGVETPGGLKSQDACLLQQAVTSDQSYEEINPVFFPEFCAPHIAADIHGRILSVDSLRKCSEPALSRDVDVLMIEGAGGWRVPLNDHETLADFAKAISSTVIFVVGVRLGCLNHAFLTAEALEKDNMPCLGWIANCCDPSMQYTLENITMLKNKMPWPLLDVLDYTRSV